MIYDRMRDFIEKFIVEDIPINLCHGDRNLRNIKSIDKWFKTSKKNLLVSYGAGTIDQLMMMDLNVKHNYMRHFGLKDKVIVIDEIHCYDDYMAEIILKNIQSLIELNCSIIIMSATIPDILKEKIFKNNFSNDSYPLITYFNNEMVIKENIKNEREQNYYLNINYLNQSDTENDYAVDMCKKIIQKANDGNNVLCICNTVSNSIKYYKNICKEAEDDIEIVLIHSRFSPHAWG